MAKSTEQINQESDLPQDQCITFKEAHEALRILLAQIGNYRIRTMHQAKIEGYLVMQEMKLKEYQKRELKDAPTDDWKELQTHIEALAKVYNELDVTCPPHQHY